MGSIDTLFDLADDVIDAFDQIVPETSSSSEACPPSAPSPSPAPARAPSPTPTRGRFSSTLAPARPAPAPRTSAPTKTTALARRGATFKIVEAFNEAREMVWVVTDGDTRVECDSRELAQRVRDALG